MKELFQKYLSNELSKRELDLFMKQLNSSSEEELLDEFDESLQTEWNDYESSGQLHPEYKQRLLGNIVDRKGIKLRVLKSNYKRKWMIRAAALLIGILSVGYAFYGQVEKYESYQTAGGEHITIHLPDNSTIILNGNSEVRYLTNWNDEEPREIWLKGEAFFDIEQIPDRKNPEFVVYSGSVDVRVLGTSFNVRTNQEKTSVVLETGKVNLVSLNNWQMDMVPGEKVTFEKTSGDIKKEIVVPASYRSWVQNKLNFDNTKLSDVAKRVHDTFGVKIIIENEDMKNRRFNGVAYLNELDKFSEILRSAFQVQVEMINHQTIIIR